MGEQIEGTSVSPLFTAHLQAPCFSLEGWLGTDDLYKVSHLGPRCLPRATLLNQGLRALSYPFIPLPLSVGSLCGQGTGWGHLSVTLPLRIEMSMVGRTWGSCTHFSPSLSGVCEPGAAGGQAGRQQCTHG